MIIYSDEDIVLLECPDCRNREDVNDTCPRCLNTGKVKYIPVDKVIGCDTLRLSG